MDRVYLAWTNRRFPTINFGRIFPYKYDRRHDASVVVNYKLNDYGLLVLGIWNRK